jgi:hypothetical protein
MRVPRAKSGVRGCSAAALLVGLAPAGHVYAIQVSIVCGGGGGRSAPLSFLYGGKKCTSGRT